MFVKAVPVTRGDDYVMYRSTKQIKDINARYVQDKIDTVEKIFRVAVRQHGNKPALGTRQVLAEEDELQPNGQMFKKV